MLRAPSQRRKRQPKKDLNLVPILDAVFILIFFLLMSASFVKINEIASDVPIVSSRKPPKTNKKPLALTLKITGSRLILYKGVPSTAFKTIRKLGNGDYDLELLHMTLIKLKKRYKSESDIIIEPVIDVNYEWIVKIMDSVRSIRKTDPAIYKKNKDGTDEKIEELFSKIVFGNIQS